MELIVNGIARKSWNVPSPRYIYHKIYVRFSKFCLHFIYCNKQIFALFNRVFDYLCWIFNFHLNVRETQIALKYVSVCKLWISCKLFLPFVHNVKYKNINLIETPEHKKTKVSWKTVMKISWEEPGYWPFYSTKMLYSTTKIKKFSSSKVSRAVCKYSAYFFKSATLAFILTCHQKTWEEPCVVK